MYDDSFDDDDFIKKFSSYGNNKIKDVMIEYIVWGKPNNKKLGFGDCPLNVYTDIYLRGKHTHSHFSEKIEDKAFLTNNYHGKNPKRDFQKFTMEKLTQIALSMKEISCKISEYPTCDLALKNIISKAEIEKSEEDFFNNQTNKKMTNIPSLLSNDKVLLKDNNIRNNSFKRGHNNKKGIKFNMNLNKLHKNSHKRREDSSKMDEDEDSSYYNNDSEYSYSDVDYNKKKEKRVNDINDLVGGYICDICGQSFWNGQGLGGHMSRKHPNQSKKYKFKKETREKRNSKREILYKAKRILLARYKEEYDSLKIYPEGRRRIKKICKEHKQEYYQIKRDIKSSRNLQLRRKSSKK